MNSAAIPLRHRLDDAIDALAAGVACVAFWASIVLPFLHVPVLVAVGLTETTTPVLAGLWGLNGLGLVVGASHTPQASHGPFESHDDSDRRSDSDAGDDTNSDEPTVPVSVSD